MIYVSDGCAMGPLTARMEAMKSTAVFPHS